MAINPEMPKYFHFILREYKSEFRGVGVEGKRAERLKLNAAFGSQRERDLLHFSKLKKKNLSIIYLYKIINLVYISWNVRESCIRITYKYPRISNRIGSFDKWTLPVQLRDCLAAVGRILQYCSSLRNYAGLSVRSWRRIRTRTIR